MEQADSLIIRLCPCYARGMPLSIPNNKKKRTMAPEWCAGERNEPQIKCFIMGSGQASVHNSTFNQGIIMARTFKQMIENIRKSDEVLMGAVVECSAYVLQQYHANNRKVDGAGDNLAQQLIAATPVWLRPSMQGWLQQGKRDTSMTLERAEDVASAKITGFFREQEQKREQARVKRAAAKAAPKVEKSDQSAPSESESVAVPMLTSCILDSEGNMLELSAEELSAVLETVAAMRLPKMLKAA
jgi:hypothetical protein